MLTVSFLKFAYNDHEVFNDISFELAPGEILHLQGPNGVGKSTLLKILGGLLPIQHGKILWDGKELGSERKRFFAYLGAETNGLYLAMNAFENLRFWLRLGGTGGFSSPEKSLIETTLSAWGLDRSYLQHDLPVGYFSTGMRRRLALARLQLTQASCWLLDEPIYGLDRKGVALFRQGLVEHSRRGGSALIVSHDFAALANLPLMSLELPVS